VLANEEVIGGVSERGGHPVVRIPLRQWMLRITAYADRLDRELGEVAWPESIKKLQRDWIGRSTGAEVDFFVPPAGSDAAASFAGWQTQRAAGGFPETPGTDVLRVYTTRPDTLYGVTFMVVAPEHPLVDRLTLPGQRAAITAYREAAARKSDLDRTDLARDKSGVFTGSHVLHPLTGKLVPVWVADYVLASYGTGAIMSVPAHDDRDFEFAQAFGLEVVTVIEPSAGETPESGLFTGRGRAVASGPYTGLASDAFITQVAADLAAAGLGRAAVNYKLRDWLFSRQRFWGEPFPILHELDAEGRPTGVVCPVAEAELPVPLPPLADFKPGDTPDPPLSRAGHDWLSIERAGRRYRRETNTMPQWAGSCWYYLRFLDPHNTERFIDPEVERAWMPVDLYVGGAEHAVLHLLYSRFWHKVLFDRGHVSCPEPFGRLVNQGMILGEMEFTGYRGVSGGWVSAENRGEADTPVRLPAEQVEKQGEHFVIRDLPKVRVESRAYKMSKSRGNVVNPDQVVKEFGADSLRLYEMFMGPLEATKPWSTAGVGGVRTFLERCWRLVVDERADELALAAQVVADPPTDDQLRELHRMIDKVTKDIPALSFNTAIARMMEFVNFCTPLERRPRAILEPFVTVLAPFAPHLAEELWELLGKPAPVSLAPWPAVEATWLVDDTVEIPVQVQGKLRGRVVVPAREPAPTRQPCGRPPRPIRRSPNCLLATRSPRWWPCQAGWSILFLLFPGASHERPSCPRPCPRRWSGHPPLPAYPRPLEAGRAAGGQIPHHRCAAFKLHQLGAAADLRAHAIQFGKPPQPHPPHLHLRRLQRRIRRDSRRPADARRRRGLVSGHRRRRSPKPPLSPAARYQARAHPLRRPALPDELRRHARHPHRDRCRRDDRRHPRA
jgi:leucyl-tRNA synthetase